MVHGVEVQFFQAVIARIGIDVIERDLDRTLAGLRASRRRHGGGCGTRRQERANTPLVPKPYWSDRLTIDGNAPGDIRLCSGILIDEREIGGRDGDVVDAQFFLIEYRTRVVNRLRDHLHFASPPAAVTG
jgi:hypothetical protein